LFEYRDRWSAGARAVLLVLASLVAAISIATAAVHAADAYGNDRVSGSWLVLAERADRGTLYPALYDGDAYAGTRWMPLPILAFAAAHRLGGHGYLPAKLTVYLLGVVLIVLLVACVRRFGAPLDVTAALAAVLVGTSVGFNAVTTIAGDTLALIFALGALMAVGREGADAERSSIAVAALLAALAVLSKSSSLWVVAAIALFLVLRRHRTHAAMFLGLTAVLAVAGVIATNVASNGRFLTNLRELSVAGYGGATHVLVDTPVRFVSLAQQFDMAVFMLVPLAFTAVLLRAGRGSLSVFDVALPIAVVATVVVLADAGTYTNHLLEASILVLIGVGSLWTMQHEPAAAALRDVVVRAALGVALLAALLTALKPVAAETIRDIRAGGATRYGQQLAAAAVGPNDSLLSEDPGIPYELRRRPIVSDSFMLPRIAKRHPADVDALIRRIRRKGFSKIILDVPVGDEHHFATGDFGLGVTHEIRHAYELSSVVGGRFVYTPR
jgi:hypothetical protein